MICFFVNQFCVVYCPRPQTHLYLLAMIFVHLCQIEQRRKEADAAEQLHQQAQSVLSDAAAQALRARTEAEAQLQAKLDAERALREQLEATALQMQAAEAEVQRVRLIEGAAASEQATARLKVGTQSSSWF